MSADEQFILGEDLAGYVLEALVGRGGMGEVYRAHDPRLNRPVALKLLTPRLADDARFRERLLDESRRAAALDHPNVVPIYEAGEADGRLFIAMRYVEGTDLKSLLRREGALEPRRVIALASQVAAALDAAHARGLVHRDVKPSNILIDEQGGREHCYLADFGLTETVSEQAPADGQLLGTLEYVAPEQLRGDPVDGRADVYALGCLLFEALTGTLPFSEASDVALIYAHLEQTPPRPTDRRPELPAAVDDVIARAMAKEPTERPESCGELVGELEAALGLHPSPRDLARRQLPEIGVVLTLLATLIAIVVILLTQGGGAASAAPSGSVMRVDPRSNTVTGRYRLGPHPGQVAFAAGRVWVISHWDPALWQVNPASGEVRRISDPGTPGDLAALGGTVFVVGDDPNLQRGSVVPYDAVTGLRQQGMTAHACSITAGAEFGVVVSACPVIQALSYRAGVLETKWQTVIPFAEPRTTENSRVCQCDMSIGFGDLWVAGDPTDARAWRIDRHGRIVATVDVPFGVRSISAGLGGVWVTGPLDDRVARIDPLTNRVTDSLTTGRGASGVAVGAGGVWVANAIDGTLTRIDPRARRVVATIRLGGRPTEVTVGGGAVWVTVDGA